MVAIAGAPAIRPRRLTPSDGAGGNACSVMDPSLVALIAARWRELWNWRHPPSTLTVFAARLHFPVKNFAARAAQAARLC
jgi:hypothetical protein